ncbi:glycosyltransferase family 2 protein [Sphingomonas corticis]|jgi:succinoglycan biosynthesis protein ExoA|uniref:Glycosyltransferase family 2 protein n=1 Tax=Sphingomonas corticis TaxID=2722791 RepID=A0ABX1CI69_9SPHN|nr:glycosyltransferase family 2 protein [Sphingomonas corticis]NJR77699.1 glycosyltransferase family 2 protein [Sphingomonas corticis]
MTAAVVIPTLDEEAHIAALLAQCAALPAAAVREIVVADGGSRDATRALVAEAAARDPRIRLVDNPRRIQSAGINDAVATLDPAVTAFVRIDAHADYADDYVPRVLAELARTGADVLATRLRTEGRTPMQRAIAAAQNSSFGAGGSAHRQGGYSGWVDHGHHAGFARAMFARLGGYDATFVANEDGEYDARVRRAGGRIWLAGEIEVGYYPRRTLAALARQYRRYGTGRAANSLKHREIRVRQLLPPAVVGASIAGLVAAPWWPWALVLPLGYLLGLAAATALLVRRTGRAETMLALPALATMHLAWGAGFLTETIRHTLDRFRSTRVRAKRGSGVANKG